MNGPVAFDDDHIGERAADVDPDCERPVSHDSHRELEIYTERSFQTD